METTYVVLALLSAFLHAAWNAAVKTRPQPTHAMTAQMTIAAVLMLPMLVAVGLPAASAIPWMLASAVINTVTVSALLKGYAYAGFGLVYPVARALSVVLVVPGAMAVFGERLGVPALTGIACISVALVMLARTGRGNASPPVVAWFWIGLAGVTTAVNVLCDVQGVRAAGNAVAYGCCTSALNALLMLWRQRRAQVDIVAIRREIILMTPVALASVTSYLLILYVYTKSPVAPASALRDTSAVIAVVLAVVWLKEVLASRQIAALVLVALAIPLLRLG